MPTYGQIVDDIVATMGWDHDDAIRNREAVLYNVTLVVAKLQKQRLSKQLGTGDTRAASSSTSTYIVPITTLDVDEANVVQWDAKYFDLRRQVYSLDFDGGIRFIRYLRNEIPMHCDPAVALTPFTGYALESLNAIYGSAYQRPSPSRPAYARARAEDGDTTKDRVYLFGVGEGVNHLLVGVLETPNYSTLDPDASVDLPDEYMHTLKEILLDDEAWLLQIPQERLHSDGRDLEPGQTVSVRPNRSINDPSKQDA